MSHLGLGRALSLCAVALLGATQLAAQGVPHWFASLDSRITDLRGREEIRVVLVGDTGYAEELAVVARGIVQQCAESGCDLGVLLGDNFYVGLRRHGPERANDEEFGSYFHEPLSGLGPGFDFWAVLGNHAYHRGGKPQAQIGHTFMARPGQGPDWLMPDHGYSIPKLPDWLHIHAIDSTRIIKKKPRWRKQIEAIETNLCGQEGWRILVGHHPFYTSGSHSREESREQIPMRQRVEETLQSCKTHLYWAGHDHDQEIVEAGSYVQLVQGAGSDLRPQRPIPFPSGVQSVGFWEKKGFGIVTFREEELSLRYFEVAEPRAGEDEVQVREILSCAWSRAQQEAAKAGWLAKVCGRSSGR